MEFPFFDASDCDTHSSGQRCSTNAPAFSDRDGRIDRSGGDGRSCRCQPRRFRNARRILGDKILCSAAAFISVRIPRQIRGQFPGQNRMRGRRFKSLLLHTSVSRFLEMSENRSKSARVRAICNRAWTRRAPSAAQIARIRQNLSGRDFARSVDHRRRFAWGRNARLPTSAIDLQGDRGCTRRGGVRAAKVAFSAHA